jgi:hypothetical protein
MTPAPASHCRRPAAIRVFVVAMENRMSRIYGNFEDAPFINGT